MSKSHDNTSMYVDTVINFANYHKHTHTTYIHILHTTYRMSDHIVSTELSSGEIVSTELSSGETKRHKNNKMGFSHFA